MITSQINAICDLRNSNGKISRELMAHALDIQIDHIAKHPRSSGGRKGMDQVHKHSYRALVGGLYNAINEGQDVRPQIKNVKAIDNLYDCFALNQEDDLRVDFIKAKLNITMRKSPPRAQRFPK